MARNAHRVRAPVLPPETDNVPPRISCRGAAGCRRGAYEIGRLPERARVTFAPARQLNLLAVVSKQHHDKAITLGDADLRFPDFLTVDQENPPQDVAAVIPGSCRPGGKCEMRSTQARPRAARLRPNQKLGSCEWRRSRCGGRRGRGSGDWRCPGASRRG